MCGIVGYISRSQIDTDVVKKMAELVHHRGPDASGFWSYSKGDVNIAFAHKRLAIIDLRTTADQPMELDRFVIVFNGEIYNYLELRNLLQGKGYKFKGDSDTEVLLRAYEEWGATCLERLNGMFAFVIFDKREHAVFAARDRFGIKPVYYKFIKGGVVFVSEPKQISALGMHSQIADIDVVNDFIQKRTHDHNESTFFKDIKQLESGSSVFIDIKTNSFEKTRWYNVGEKLCDETVKEVGFFFEALSSSISIRLRSDVDVGVSLSGGLDSSTIAYLASKDFLKCKGGKRLKSVTASMKDPSLDEWPTVKEFAELLSLDAVRAEVDNNDLTDISSKLEFIYDQPVWSESVSLQCLVYKKAKENNLKVMLSGQGADEILCGYTSLFYPVYLRSLLFEKFDTLKLFKELVKPRFYYGLKRMIINSLRTSSSGEYGFFKQGGRGKPRARTLNELSLQLLSSHLRALLHYEDRSSMSNSVESRLPFLDYSVVEKALNLESDLKFFDGKGKKVLRDFIQQVSPRLLKSNKRKKGFSVSKSVWFESNYEEIISSIKSLEYYGGVDSKKLRAFLEKIDSKKRNDDDEGVAYRLWSLARWMKLNSIKSLE